MFFEFVIRTNFIILLTLLNRFRRTVARMAAAMHWQRGRPEAGAGAREAMWRRHFTGTLIRLRQNTIMGDTTRPPPTSVPIIRAILRRSWVLCPL